MINIKNWTKTNFSTCRHRQTVLVIFVEQTFFVQFLRRIKKILFLLHFIELLLKKFIFICMKFVVFLWLGVPKKLKKSSFTQSKAKKRKFFILVLLYFTFKILFFPLFKFFIKFLNIFVLFLVNTISQSIELAKIHFFQI